MINKKKILFCTVFDDGFIEGGLNVIYSLIKNVPNFLDYSHKIFISDFCKLSDENIKKIKKLLPDVIIEKNNQEVYKKVNVMHKKSRADFNCLEMFNQKDYDIVCFFDADMLCVKDITDGIKLAEQYDFVAHCQSKVSTCNSGFMIIGKNILMSDTYERMISFISNNMLGNYVSRLISQEVMNARLIDNFSWYDLTHSYNFRNFAKWNNWDGYEDATMIHWAGAMPGSGQTSVPKPWNDNALDDKATKLWLEYRDECLKEFGV
tara:strand:+ start:87 stop:875 length:789 start_codon:yes stop_codon:yes gene_type:complete